MLSDPPPFFKQALPKTGEEQEHGRNGAAWFFSVSPTQFGTALERSMR
jgi:hypothetical protein